MPGRICVDCGRVTSGAARCDECRAVHAAGVAARRGTTTQRGLGYSHRRAVAALKARVIRTDEPCFRCGGSFAEAADVTGDREPPRAVAEGGELVPGIDRDGRHYRRRCVPCQIRADEETT
jgi:hypothetical protein